MNDISTLINIIRNSQDPSAMVSSMAKLNPDVSAMLSALQQNGGTVKSAFYEMCKQKNVDPNSILNNLR